MGTDASILVVEDEFLLAMDLETTLEDQGFRITALASSVAQAMAALDRERPDAVTLDMNLNGERSVSVAARLRAEAIPFVVLSGYGERHAYDRAYRDAPLIRKPWDPAELVATLRDLIPRAAR